MTLDLDAIAREADPQYKGNQQSQFDSSCLPLFAALLLEKAAQVCEGMHEEDRPGDYADAVRSMAAGMGE